MKYSVAISGSYNGGRVEDLFKELSMDGILHMSLIGREVSLQVGSEDLESVKKRLGALGIENIAVLEWKKRGVSVADPGSGKDETIEVSLIPSVKGGGITRLSFSTDLELAADLQEKLSARLEEILSTSGVTDTLYTITVLGEAGEKEYAKSVEKATLKALFNSGGVVDLD